MREMKLKYFIDLVSNVGQRAAQDAKVMEQAQRQMQSAIVGTSSKLQDWDKVTAKTVKDVGLMQGVLTGTTSKFVALDRAMSSMGTNSGSARQVSYMQQLSNQIEKARAGAARLRESLSKPLGEGGDGNGKGGKGAGGSNLMSDVQRLAGYVGVANMARSAFDDNMEFEKLQLKMKFNAQLSDVDVATLRGDALALSKSSLNKPLDVAKAQFRLANAGLKMDSIRRLTPSVANAAQVFDATPDQIADLVFDMVTKSGIREDRVPAMLDMLYAHATSGRFETMDMARQAPAFLNAFKNVGIGGERGLNLAGALTQRMMRNATVTNPSEVTTIIQEGLAHITTPHMTGLDGKKHSQGATGLMKFGINVSDYFDKNGNFLGDGGVDGLVGLARAMKSKHLDNPFIMGQAGIREHYTQLFWREMMASIDADDSDKDPNLLKMMERGAVAQKSNQLAKNLEDVKKSGFGKMQDAAINTQSAAVGGFGAAATAGVANMVSWASNHPWTMVGAGVLGAGATIATGGLAGPWVLGALGAAGGTAALGAGINGLADWWNKPSGVPAMPPAVAPRTYAPGMSGFSGIGAVPPVDFFTISAPGSNLTQVAAGRATELKVGEGTLLIDVRVTNDGATATPSVLRQPSLIRLNPGATNPGGLR